MELSPNGRGAAYLLQIYNKKLEIGNIWRKIAAKDGIEDSLFVVCLAFEWRQYAALLFTLSYSFCRRVKRLCVV